MLSPEAFVFFKLKVYKGRAPCRRVDPRFTPGSPPVDSGSPPVHSNVFGRIFLQKGISIAAMSASEPTSGPTGGGEAFCKMTRTCKNQRAHRKRRGWGPI